MKRALALLGLLVVAAAGGSSSASSATKSEASRLVLRGSLPAQGFLLSRGRDTVLIGLDGHVHARLAGLRPSWFANGDSARGAAFQQLAAIVPGSPLLSDSDGRWYLFDSHGRLEPLRSPRLRLSGNVDVVAHATPSSDHVFRVDLNVHRGGRVLVPVSAEVRRISGNLVVGQSIAVDLQTGHRWHVASNCYPVATTADDLLMFCGAKLLSVSPSGLRTTLATIPKSLFASSAYLSPDGKYVVGMFTPGCGAPYGFVVPTDGGAARPLSGEKGWTSAGPSSMALGWTPDNRVVAIVEPSSKLETEPKAGVYLIDPSTLTRRLVYPSPSAWAMWNPSG